MTVAFTSSSQIPTDAAYIIFSYLDLRSLRSCCFVSRTWLGLASDDLLWKRLCQRIFPGIALPATGIKAHLLSHCITTSEALILRIKAFASTIPQDQMGQFSCRFLTAPNCSMTIEMGKLNTSNQPALIDFAIFINTVSQGGYRNTGYEAGSGTVQIRFLPMTLPAEYAILSDEIRNQLVPSYQSTALNASITATVRSVKRLFGF
jgi:hypothetical protein